MKHVIDALIDALNTNLNKGLSVQLGDFGCFRPGMNCKSQNEEKDVGIDIRNEAVSLQYKRVYFNDWRVCDRYKDSLFHEVDFWLDTHIAGYNVAGWFRT